MQLKCNINVAIIYHKIRYFSLSCIIKYIVANIGFLIRLIITYYFILNYNLKTNIYNK